MVKVLPTVERELLITVCDICGDEVPDVLFDTGRALMIKHCTNGYDGAGVYSLTQDTIDLCNDCFAIYTDMLPIKSSLHSGDRAFEWNEKAFEQGGESTGSTSSVGLSDDDVNYFTDTVFNSGVAQNEVLNREDDVLVNIPDHI